MSFSSWGSDIYQKMSCQVSQPLSLCEGPSHSNPQSVKPSYEPIMSVKFFAWTETHKSQLKILQFLVCNLQQGINKDSYGSP